ncbi:hypothetical protein CTAYLR_002862 [Chrysophaeum taylorii]|uniref:tetrahydrofolate synthase n=1 Tax=Chrysophaeum taylorii TaxID=2483200 RepID=A0AAD7XG32_9STRA|nr:hypothetical protein CTAYLR_002862 [Chrysophaeum taylorii]
MFPRVQQPRRRVIEELLAAPAVHPRRLNMSAAERARRRLAFFRSLSREIGGVGRYVHVAGTKGKGSVCELVRAGLEGHGVVGCFTSPHLHSARERMRIGRTPISSNDLARFGGEALDRVAAVDRAGDEKGWGAVFFDRLLATALLYFAERSCDVVILEAGIGGSYDSTNFTEPEDVALSVITSISYDHTALLGSTLSEIAAHKAGIMRPGKLALTPATQAPEAMSALGKRAADVGAALEVVPSSGASTADENRALAHRATVELGVPEPDFRGARWPARFEIVELRGRRLLVDAAHNGDSISRLFRDADARFPGVRWLVIFGCGEEKEDMLGAIEANARNVSAVVTVEAAYGRDLPPSKRPARAADLAKRFNPKVIPAQPASPPSTSAALDSAAAYPNLLVCGSLYVAAEAREWAFHLDPSAFPLDDWVRLRDI